MYSIVQLRDDILRLLKGGPDAVDMTTVVELDTLLSSVWRDDFVDADSKSKQQKCPDCAELQNELDDTELDLCKYRDFTNDVDSALSTIQDELDALFKGLKGLP